MTAPHQPKPSGADDFPYWFVALVVLGVAIAAAIVASDLYVQVFITVARGLGITVLVTLIAFSIAVPAFGQIVARKIGGHTGDTIGAAQQLTEIAVLAALALAA